MFRIRSYEPADLPHLSTICLLTGDSGRDGTAIYSDPRLIGQYYATPYAAYDPTLCLILADELGPCGYILGAVNTTDFVRWFNREWLPPLREEYRDQKPWSGRNDSWLYELIQRDATLSTGLEGFPAHLHIDLLPRAQRRGWGRRLFTAWTELAASRGAVGVHLGVAPANANAIGFYESLGMRRHSEVGAGCIYLLKLAGVKVC